MKYGQEELKEKAVAFLQYMEQGDPRADLCLMMVCMATNVSYDEALRRIRDIAEGK